jgi:hypothetical protein
LVWTAEHLWDRSDSFKLPPVINDKRLVTEQRFCSQQVDGRPQVGVRQSTIIQDERELTVTFLRETDAFFRVLARIGLYQRRYRRTPRYIWPAAE